MNNKEVTFVSGPGININCRKINIMKLADEIIIIRKKHRSLMLNKLQKEERKIGLKINLEGE